LEPILSKESEVMWVKLLAGNKNITDIWHSIICIVIYKCFIY
jgi:hypothetical protein